MKPVISAELSALIDGELTAEREKEVRQAILENPALKEEHERLLSAHVRLTDFALASTQSIQVSRVSSIGTTSSEHPARFLTLAGVAMLALRLLSKLLPMGWGIGLSVAAIVVVMAIMIRHLIELSDSAAAQNFEFQGN